MSTKLTIDPEFRDKIPPLTETEYAQLRENILADGEVYEPIIVWNGTIIDGHNRWKIIQEHPEIPYKIKQMDFPDRHAAIVWMCKKQIGRRNITDEQRTVLIGEAYKAQKMSRGAAEGFRGNQHTKVVTNWIIAGLTKFYATYSGAFKQDDLKRVLQMVTPAAIIREGKGCVGRKDTVFARIILRIYNKKRTSRRLEDLL